MIIIGAGPAGLTAAHLLSKAGVAVTVLEAGDEVGGFCKTIELWGQRVDIGPHRFFSHDRGVNQLWLEFAETDYHMVKRLTRIYYRRRFFDYPLKAGNALKNLGLFQAIACVTSYVTQKLFGKHHRADHFEGWIVQHFGRRLYELFFKTYSEKLWGIPCNEIDADFAAQRIKKFSLGEAIRNALGLSRRRHKTLVDEFAYPLEGTGMIYQRMADRVRQHGGIIEFRSPVAGLVHEEKQVRGVRLKDGSVLNADHVISTMPLTLLAQSLAYLPEPVAQAIQHLTYRNTILVYLHLDGDNLFRDQWLYVHSPDLLCGRITNFRNWAPELYGEQKATILALEFWCNAGDPIWREEDSQLIHRAICELKTTGLHQDKDVIEGKVVRLPRCYPVYRTGYKNHLNVLINYLSGFKGLSPIGRYGAFKYNNQDHSIHMGILAAENLLDNAGHDLWSVNTDYDTYHEACRITETGLVANH